MDEGIANEDISIKAKLGNSGVRGLTINGQIEKREDFDEDREGEMVGRNGSGEDEAAIEGEGGGGEIGGEEGAEENVGGKGVGVGKDEEESEGERERGGERGEGEEGAAGGERVEQDAGDYELREDLGEGG